MLYSFIVSNFWILDRQSADIPIAYECISVNLGPWSVATYIVSTTHIVASYQHMSF